MLPKGDFTDILMGISKIWKVFPRIVIPGPFRVSLPVWKDEKLLSDMPREFSAMPENFPNASPGVSPIVPPPVPFMIPLYFLLMRTLRR